MVCGSYLEAYAAAPAVPDIADPGVLLAELLAALEDLRHPDVGAVCREPGLEVEVFVHDVHLCCPVLVDCHFDVVGADEVAVETTAS